MRTRPDEGAVRRVLVVDDDVPTLFALVEQLSGRFAVTAVRSAEAALEMSPETYDAIVVELHLAGLSAVQLKSQLDARLVAVPVIFVSTDPALPDYARGAGAFGFAWKPFTAGGDLEAVLARAVDDGTFVPPQPVLAAVDDGAHRRPTLRARRTTLPLGSTSGRL